MNIKVLQLCKSKQGGSRNHVDTKDRSQAVIINIKRILKRKLSVSVRLHGPCIFDYIYVAWWPSSRNVRDNRLL